MTEAKPYLLRFKQGSKIAEFGGGNNPLFHLNYDVRSGPNIDVVVDFNKPLSIENETYDNIYCSYAIEHISWRNLKQFLSETYRVLRKGGCAVFVTADLLEQCKKVVEVGVNQGSVELIFGSQEFTEDVSIGCHKCGFSPLYAQQLFTEAGFSIVKIFPHPVSSTDMIIECYKIDKKELFEREYFEDGTTGYKEYNCWSFDFTTADRILEQKPESVLCVGDGRGYVARILQNNGIKATAIDISNHCYATRATDDFYVWDIMDVPWKKVSRKPPSEDVYVPVSDKEYDLCFSLSVLEHIPENKIDSVIKEMSRVSKRGFHGIHMTDSPYTPHDVDYDVSHFLLKDKAWWVERFKSVAPDYQVIIEHERIVQYEQPEINPPKSHAPGMYKKDGEILAEDGLAKINFGCYKDCFYFGWINIDILDMKSYADQFGFNFIQHDVTKPLPVKDGSIDLAFSSHLLEHLTRDEGYNFLKECHRIMKPGGIIRLSVPDTKKITSDYIEGRIKEHRFINTGVADASDDVEAYYNLLLAGHKTLYDSDSLQLLLSKMGFKNIEKSTPFTSGSKTISTQTITPHPTLSLVMEAEK